jgi:LSD1 subclass zinc finger protein
MSEDARTLQCPSCGATLDPPVGQTSMKCSYCQSTVEIPAAAQVQAPAPAPLPYDPNIVKILALAGADRFWRWPAPAKGSGPSIWCGRSPATPAFRMPLRSWMRSRAGKRWNSSACREAFSVPLKCSAGQSFTK